MSDICKTCGKTSRFGTPYYICEDSWHDTCPTCGGTREKPNHVSVRLKSGYTSGLSELCADPFHSKPEPVAAEQDAREWLLAKKIIMQDGEHLYWRWGISAEKCVELITAYYAPLRAEVERLIRERDEARQRLIYGDQKSNWGAYHRAKDGERPSGGNIGAWYESAVFWRCRSEAAEEVGVKFGEFPDHFKATNVRAESAESALREAQERIRAIIDGSQYAEDNDLDICHICRPGIDHRHEEGCPILAAERFMMKRGDTQ